MSSTTIMAASTAVNNEKLQESGSGAATTGILSAGVTSSSSSHVASGNHNSKDIIKKQVPAGYTVHREAGAEVLLADGRDVFINPIQEFNRDLSSLTIRTWSELVDEEKKAKWERKKQSPSQRQADKKRKHEDEEASAPKATEEAETVAIPVWPNIPS